MNLGKISLISIFVIVSLAKPLLALAELHLSVNSNSGGSSISFGRAFDNMETNKEVRIRVTSTAGTQYQIYQRLVEPLVNEKGASLSSQAIETYALPGSNASGTMYLQSPVSLSQGEELVYSSTPNGDSDNLTLVYSLKPNRVDASGSFQGRILYTVRSIGSNQRDEVFLNITFDALGELKMNVEGANYKDKVSLRFPDQLETQSAVKINFSGNNGRIKIYQEADQLPQNDSFEIINKELIKIKSISQSGSNLSEGVLENRRTLIYESQASEDNINVNLNIDPQLAEKQNAGTYKTRLKYSVETTTQHKEFFIDLDIDIAPVFKLEVEFPAEGMSFDRVLPDAPPQFKKVKVKVNSNLGKPYTVTQNVQATLTNEKGAQVPKEFFTVNVELPDNTKGRSVINEFKPINVGEQSLFTSGNKGESAEVDVIYRLKSFPEITPGVYSASIVYSLNQN